MAPKGGQWDRDAVEFFHRRVEEAQVWGPAYLIADNRLVGAPDSSGHQMRTARSRSDTPYVAPTLLLLEQGLHGPAAPPKRG